LVKDFFYGGSVMGLVVVEHVVSAFEGFFLPRDSFVGF
jgi:hypothetical protein